MCERIPRSSSIILLAFSQSQIPIHMVVQYDGVEDGNHEPLQDDALLNYQNIFQFLKSTVEEMIWIHI